MLTKPARAPNQHRSAWWYRILTRHSERIYSAELDRVFTPNELADVESFFLGPRGKRYSQYMILRLYAVGKPAPGRFEGYRPPPSGAPA